MTGGGNGYRPAGGGTTRLGSGGRRRAQARVTFHSTLPTMWTSSVRHS